MPRHPASLAACALALMTLAAPALGNPSAPAPTPDPLSATGQVGIVSAGLQASGLIVTFALPEAKSDPVARPTARIVSPAELVEDTESGAPFGKFVERES
ncbi:hypothetical protein [Pararhodobacter marinus]|uniref:hypothetical protein n=1 Tax=Pararhodobacter marinus TaxID=2184063 RepID=UPI0035197A7C